jgi:nucleoside phosphorylase
VSGSGLAAVYGTTVKILVTFALENEFAPWRKMRNFKRVAADQWDHSYREQIGEASVRVFLTGAGRFAVQRAAGIAFEEKPDVCIVSGLSGGLRPEHSLAKTLVARNVTGSNGASTHSGHPDLLATAAAAGAKLVDRFLTSDHVVADSEEKRKLGSHADAVDMESFWVLSAAADRGIPGIAIRAVSDTVDSNLPLDFGRVFNEQGAVSIPKVIGQLAKHPSKVAGLLRLANDSERAAANLARVLDSFVVSVTNPPLIENAKAAALSV